MDFAPEDCAVEMSVKEQKRLITSAGAMQGEEEEHIAPLLLFLRRRSRGTAQGAWRSLRKILST
jgi:hypothetical protein